MKKKMKLESSNAQTNKKLDKQTFSLRFLKKFLAIYFQLHVFAGHAISYRLL